MMRPYRARCRIRGVFNRNQAGFPGGRGRGRGGNLAPILPQAEQSIRPRVPTFYPHDDIGEKEDSYNDMMQGMKQHHEEELYETRREEDFRQRRSRSRSPSRDRFQRSQSRSRHSPDRYGFRARSKSRSRYRSRSPSPSRRHRSPSAPPRRRSPSQPPRRRSPSSPSRRRSPSPRKRRRSRSYSPSPSRSRRSGRSRSRPRTARGSSRSPSRYRKQRDGSNNEVRGSPSMEMIRDHDIKVTVTNIKPEEQKATETSVLREERYVQRKEFNENSPHGREEHVSPSSRWPVNFTHDPVDMFSALEKRDTTTSHFESEENFRQDSYVDTRADDRLSNHNRQFSHSPSPSQLRHFQSRWSNSPAPSHESDQRPEKSILKRKQSSLQEENSQSVFTNIPGISADLSSIVIPGLGDMDTIDDEEKFLYGEEVGSGASADHRNQSLRNQEQFKTRRNYAPASYTRDVEARPTLSRAREESPKHSPMYRRDSVSHKDTSSNRDSPMQGDRSPFCSRRMDARFNESFSPRSDEVEKRRKFAQEDEMRHKVKDADEETNRKVEEVLKSLGFDSSVLRKLREEKQMSPESNVDKEAEKYGIKPEMQTSSFFEGSDLQQPTNALLSNFWDNNVPTYAMPSSAPNQSYQQQPVAKPSYSTQMPTQNYSSYHDSSLYSQYSNRVITPVQMATETKVKSNLKVIPLGADMSNIKNAMRSNLKVVSTEASHHKELNTFNSGNRSINTFDQNPIRSVQDAQIMMLQRESQARQLEMLENELMRMSKLQGELMRKKQKQKDGHKDPLLIENTKLQDEIKQQINQLRNSITDTTELLKKSDVFLKIKPEKPAPHHFTNDAAVDDRSMHLKKNEAVVETDRDLEHEYFYVDSGDHWCKQCDEFMPNLQKLFDHLQRQEHHEKIAAYDIKTVREFHVPQAAPLPGSNKKPLTASIKGSQFLVPCTGYFCKLCSEFLGNNKCAENHLKSRDHNFKFLKYVLENPLYERKWNLDKTSSLAEKAHSLKLRKMEEDRTRDAQRKKRLREAEEKNRELIRVEAERAKSVGELDESTSSSSRLDASRGKDIKVNFKNAKKDGNKSRGKDESGFGKFTWKSDSEKHSEREGKEQSQEEQETESAANNQANSKIKINLIGKKLISPTASWKLAGRNADKKSQSRDAEKPKPMVGAFPLRKGKSGSSAIDIFSSPNKPGDKQGKGQANKHADDAKPEFTFSQKDIANAFGGKFNVQEKGSSSSKATSSKSSSKKETQVPLPEKPPAQVRTFVAPKPNFDINRAFKCIPEMGDTKRFKSDISNKGPKKDTSLIYGPKLPDHLVTDERSPSGTPGPAKAGVAAVRAAEANKCKNDESKSSETTVKGTDAAQEQKAENIEVACSEDNSAKVTSIPLVDELVPMMEEEKSELVNIQINNIETISMEDDGQSCILKNPIIFILDNKSYNAQIESSEVPEASAKVEIKGMESNAERSIPSYISQSSDALNANKSSGSGAGAVTISEPSTTKTDTLTSVVSYASVANNVKQYAGETHSKPKLKNDGLKARNDKLKMKERAGVCPEVHGTSLTLSSAVEALMLDNKIADDLPKSQPPSKVDIRGIEITRSDGNQQNKQLKIGRSDLDVFFGCSEAKSEGLFDDLSCTIVYENQDPCADEIHIDDSKGDCETLYSTSNERKTVYLLMEDSNFGTECPPELTELENSMESSEDAEVTSGLDVFGNPPVLSPNHERSSDTFDDNAPEGLKALYEVSEQATANLNNEIESENPLPEDKLPAEQENLEEGIIGLTSVSSPWHPELQIQTCKDIMKPSNVHVKLVTTTTCNSSQVLSGRSYNFKESFGDLINVKMAVSVDESKNILQKMKRKDLGEICKLAGIKVKGTNGEIVEKLSKLPRIAKILEKKWNSLPFFVEDYSDQSDLKSSCHATSLHTPLTDKTPSLLNRTSLDHHHQAKSPQHEKQHFKHISDDIHRKHVKQDKIIGGWCVIDGQYKDCRMYCLVIRDARAMLQLENELVPLMLTPSLEFLTEGHMENFVCKDCMERNEVLRKRPRISQGSFVRIPASRPINKSNDFEAKVVNIVKCTVAGSEEERHVLFS